jgi:SAM-dependent methyltransferase
MTSPSEYDAYAEYYDYDHDSLSELPFYLELARECGSPILELACGTGRLLAPLAEAGFEMVGIDLSEAMLAVCRRKVDEKGLAGRVYLARADMATFDLSRQDFSLAFVAFQSFMHLHTQADQLACLARAYRHLRPGGLFVVELFAPVFWMLARQPDTPFAVANEFELPNGHRVVRQNRFVRNDVVHQVLYHELHYAEYDPSGRLVRECSVPHDVRYTFPYELQLLLERAGFQVVDIFGDYDRRPYDGTRDIIAVARRG